MNIELERVEEYDGKEWKAIEETVYLKRQGDNHLRLTIGDKHYSFWEHELKRAVEALT